MSGQVALTLSCTDRPGIVRAVSDFFFGQGCDIVQSNQFGDPSSGLFFMRVHMKTSASTPEPDALAGAFARVADEFGMQWQLHDLAVRPRVLLMVSRLDHCLEDLLYRWRSGLLAADVVAVVSNHPDLAPLVEWHGVPFHHVPVTPDSKADAEQRLLGLVAELEVELVVLARYMQVLSDRVCAELSGRIINIHHSFLPSFKGARPYHRAHDRGVKLIGATAHYVTTDLDEGPIIEQDVARVDHQSSVEDLVAIGRDVESRTLARAVQWHVQRRVLLNGQRTVVFT